MAGCRGTSKPLSVGYSRRRHNAARPPSARAGIRARGPAPVSASLSGGGSLSGNSGSPGGERACQPRLPVDESSSASTTTATTGARHRCVTSARSTEASRSAPTPGGGQASRQGRYRGVDRRADRARIVRRVESLQSLGRSRAVKPACSKSRSWARASVMPRSSMMMKLAQSVRLHVWSGRSV